jgi:hypothetical protein
MSLFDDPPLHDFPDRALREALKHPDNLRELLEAIVPDLAARLDFTQVTEVSRNFLLEDWRDRESDLLFLIPFRSGEGTAPVLVCVLLEHQSQADPRMPLRMILYNVLFWDRQWREYEDNHAPGAPLRLTPVLPIVFHTAPRPWGSNRTLADLIDAPPELRPFIPQWDILFWDLADRSPDQLLTTQGFFVRFLSLVRAETWDAASFQGVYEQALQQLEALAPQDKMRWRDLLWLAVSWVLQRRPEADRAPLLALTGASQQNLALQEEAKNVSETAEKTWIESVRERLAAQLTAEITEQVTAQVTEQVTAQVTEQVTAQSEARGELRALRHTLRRWLTDRFGAIPEELEQQMSECQDTARLEAAIRRVGSIQTIDQLGF